MPKPAPSAHRVTGGSAVTETIGPSVLMRCGRPQLGQVQICALVVLVSGSVPMADATPQRRHVKTSVAGESTERG